MQTLDHAMDWVRSGAVAPDAAVDPREQPRNEALDRRAKAIQAAVNGDVGRILLDTLLDATLFRAPVDHRLQGAEYLRHAQLRQGQNQVAALLLAYLDHAQKLDRSPHGPERNPVSRAGRSDPDAFGVALPSPGPDALADPDEPDPDGWLDALAGADPFAAV